MKGGFLYLCLKCLSSVLGDRDCVRDFHTASLYVLARFALYNLILLYRLLLLCLNLLRVYPRFFLLSVSVMGIF